MTSIRYWQGIGLCGLAAFALGAAAQDGEPKWGPHIDFEAKPGSKRSLGEADLFLPLRQDARSLLFANLRGRFDDNSSREGNLGLGWRKMQESGWNLGLYGYFDRRRTDNFNYFNQATLGAEALGRDWDFRANGYVPVGTKARDLGTTSTAAISGASVQVTTSTREERALKGFDAEVGWRAPIFDSEAARQLRLYLGGYRFSDADVTVEGPRVRAELAMDDLGWFGKGTGLFLGLEAQNDGARGHQNFLSLRLRIPLGKESSRPRNLNAQERRMTAPVMRDVDVVTQSRVASTLVETANTTAGGQAITVLNSATTTGAALPGAVAAAGVNSTVILSGTFNTTAATTLQAGQTVMGAGTLSVTTPSGRTVTLTTPSATVSATIAGGGAAVTNPAFLMANNSTLTGLTVSLSRSGGAGAYAVFANSINGATIANNIITATEAGANPGIGVVLQNSTNITVSGNTITGTTGAGATATGLALVSALGNTSATVTGNTLSASGGSANNYFAFINGTAATLTINPGSTGNVRGSGTCYNGLSATGSISLTDSSHCP